MPGSGARVATAKTMSGFPHPAKPASYFVQASAFGLAFKIYADLPITLLYAKRKMMVTKTKLLCWKNSNSILQQACAGRQPG